jgi:tetratricopeptide (TPR) repeat protein
VDRGAARREAETAIVRGQPTRAQALLRDESADDFGTLALLIEAASLRCDWSTIVEHASRARMIAPDVAERIRITNVQTFALCHLRRLAEARELANLCVEEARSIDDELLEARAESRRGLVASVQGDVAGARTAYTRFATIIGKDLERLSAKERLHRAGVLHELGRLDEAVEAFDAIVTEAEGHRDRDLVCASRSMRAAAHLERGDVRQALRDAEAALAMGDSGLVPGSAAYATFVVGMAHEHANNHGAASASYANGLTMAREGGGSSEALLGASLAMTRARLGHMHEAQNAAKEAAEAATRSTVPNVSAYVELRAKMTDAILDGKKRGALDEHLAAITRGALQAEVRLLVPIAKTLLRETEGAEHGQSLRVAANGSWFVAPNAKRVSLESRPALARVLLALAQRAVSSNEPLHWTDLAQVGWQDRSASSASFDRVRTAILRLRRLGVGAMLVRTGEGYALASSALIELAPARQG